MKYFLVESKTDNIGCCNMGVYYGKAKDLKRAYWYKEIPKNHYEILSIYLNVINDLVDENETLDEYLEYYY